MVAFFYVPTHTDNTGKYRKIQSDLSEKNACYIVIYLQCEIKHQHPSATVEYLAPY